MRREGRFGGGPFHGPGPIRDVLGVHHPGRVPHHFGDGAGIGAKDGKAATHGFQKGQAETFLEGGKDKSRRPGIKGRQVRLGDVMNPPHLVHQLGGGKKLHELIPHVSLGPGQDQLVVRLGLLLEKEEGVNQAQEVLAGFQAPDEKKIGLGQPVGFPHRPHLVRRGGPLEIRRHPMGDHPHLPLPQTGKMGQDLLAVEIRGGEDQVRVPPPVSPGWPSGFCRFPREPIGDG